MAFVGSYAMRQVHAEGQRERRNMRESTTSHNHDDPKPRQRSDGRREWCCPHAASIAREQGKFNDDGEYIGEYRD